MKKMILMGRSGSGKTTLAQALNGKEICFRKTQYINHFDVIIDTPGEYLQTHTLGHALALYTYEVQVVGLLLAATEVFTLYPPNITCMCNRDVIGIVTKIGQSGAMPKRAAKWLALAGCRDIFYVDSTVGEGVGEILEYLREDGDVIQT